MVGKRKRVKETSSILNIETTAYHSEDRMWNSRGRTKRRNKSGGYRESMMTELDEITIVSMFEDIADEEEPSIATMEGICKLCEKLDIDPMEDIRVLVLMWKMGADKQPGQITKDEWIKGCHRIDVDSIDKLKALLPALDPGFLEHSDFRDFYKFCFKFNLHGTHKTHEKDLAINLMEMVLKERIDKERIETFCSFLKTTKDPTYERMTLDQWSSFLEFCVEVKDLKKDYDEENSAWPTLIDDYVEYMENQ